MATIVHSSCPPGDPVRAGNFPAVFSCREYPPVPSFGDTFIGTTVIDGTQGFGGNNRER